MRTLLITGSDTGVGKTRVVASLARLLARTGPARVQIVKVVETGRSAGEAGDAETARALSGAGDVTAFTLASFSAPLAPAAAAERDGVELSFDQLARAVRALPVCDWRLIEGAGGIATPIDASGRDWADFAPVVAVDAIVVVVPDRLGAINQARLSFARAQETGLTSGVWLNAVAPVDALVAASTRAGLRSARVPLWAEQACGAEAPADPASLLSYLENRYENVAPAEAGENAMSTRWRDALAERDQKRLRRSLRVTVAEPDVLNFADNDYLELARDPAVVQAVAAAAARYGTSASASALITGWRSPHEELTTALCSWHRFPCGLLWTSGYAANSALLSLLPARGDLVLADRLIHHSMIAGLLRSGARLQRYPHLDLDELERQLARARADAPERTVFVATESVFSMDGGYPDLRRMAQLKNEFGFFWIVDEAHALGWYGPEGAGLVRAAEVENAVDLLVGTLGKTLASGGAYSLFRDETWRDYAVNFAGEFIYSTALPPTNAAAATAALLRVKALAVEQRTWQAASRAFRAQLRADGWQAPEGDSPVVPVVLDDAEAALGLAAALREASVIAAAVRPPTVPEGTSRLRFSLKRSFGEAAAARVLAAMRAWRTAR